MRGWALFGSAIAMAVASSSCIDPVHTDAVDALGPEAAGVRTGPEHRPGQPCLVCNGGSDWVAAGTVYEVRGDLTKPLVRGIVRLEDYNGKTYEVTTNKVGNWYIEANRFSPTFPLYVSVYDSGKTIEKKMSTRIGRDGGCGTCHQGAVATTDKMPAVYLKDKP